MLTSPVPETSALLLQCNQLADAALACARDGMVVESDVKPSQVYLYTETHLALQLYLLNRAGQRPLGLKEAASRLRVWGDLHMSPTHFNSMAIALLGIAILEDNVCDADLNGIITELRKRRRDFAAVAWQRWCGNNMYVQQLATDLLFAPLSDGRPLTADVGDKLEYAFSSCMSVEGYFFDLPRPAGMGQRQFPLTYNLKFLFLLILCCHYLPDPRLRRRLYTGLESTLPLFTNQGDCSYFGRTDRTTFAAGLALFCLRAASSMGVGGQVVNNLARSAEQRFLTFPIGGDGCIEVNDFSLPASVDDLIRSRDGYAFRWQYAVAGAAYCLLAHRLFPALDIVNKPETSAALPLAFSSKDLDIVRLRVGDLSLFVRMGSTPSAEDRRYAGPTILRLEHHGATIVGAVPKTVSSDVSVIIDWLGRSCLARHLDLLRYRWRSGFEFLHHELIGFLPVLRLGHRTWIPALVLAQQTSREQITSKHRFQVTHSSGIIPTLNYLVDLARINTPAAMHFLFQPRPLLGKEENIYLNRTITLSENAVVISDVLSGDIEGKRLFVGTRFLNPWGVQASNLVIERKLHGWSSDGLQQIQLYTGCCIEGEYSYQLTLKAYE